MCVDVFGGTFSPSCSNYALKRKTADGKHQFGMAAAETLQNNSYVRNMLESLDDEKLVIKLIKNVTAMYASAGFKLTKFLSKS